MAKKNSNITIANIARLYYLEKMSQDEIAKLIGLSRSQISRLIQKAWDEGMIEIRISRPPEDTMENIAFRLEKRFTLKRAVVIPSEGAPDFIRRSLLLEAGCLLEKCLLKKNTGQKFLGVYGGKTLAEFANYYQPLFNYPELVTLPLIGDFKQSNQYLKANEIARKIADMMGSKYLLFHPSTAATFKYYQHLITCALVTVDDIGYSAYTFHEYAGSLPKIPFSIGMIFGRNKLTAILEALRTKSINCLVTDADTAENILEFDDNCSYSTDTLALVR